MNAGKYKVMVGSSDGNIIVYILSVYSPFFDRVGLPLHNTPFSGC